MLTNTTKNQDLKKIVHCWFMKNVTKIPYNSNENHLKCEWQERKTMPTNEEKNKFHCLYEKSNFLFSFQLGVKCDFTSLTLFEFLTCDIMMVWVGLCF